MRKCDFNKAEVTSNYFLNTVLEKHIWLNAFVYMKVNTAYGCSIHLFKVKKEKLEQGVNYF